MVLSRYDSEDDEEEERPFQSGGFFDQLLRRQLQQGRGAAAVWMKRFKSAYAKLDPSSRAYATASVVCTVLALAGYRQRHRLQRTTPDASEAPLSILFAAAKEGRVDKALLGTSTVYYLIKGAWKRSVLPKNLSPENVLERLSTCKDVSALPESLLSRLATPIISSLPFLYLFFLYRILRSTMGTGGSVRSHSQSDYTFRDVAGMDSVVTEVREVVTYLKNPSKYHSVGARAPRALLLYGPPGTGKTLLARAIAGEARVDCFCACDASEFVEVYVGRGAARVRSLFEQARNQAKRNHWWRTLWNWSDDSRPCAILFIDELDALAKTRMTMNSNDEREQTLNQLLTELDGFARNDDVVLIVVAASNRADVLDPAILRRFDRQVHVGLPDAQGRKAILNIHSREIKCSSDIDWDRLASESRTGDFSGAELRNLINDAALLAVRDRSPTVQQTHLEHAARRINQMKWKDTSATENIVVLGIR